MTQFSKFILLALFLGCTLKPKIGATAGTTEPIVTYSLVSGWVGLKDEIKIYPSGWIENFFANALSRKKTFRSAPMARKNLKVLLKIINKIDPATLKSEYRGGVIYDAPVENLAFEKNGKTVKIVLHPGADLPPPLAELLKAVSGVKTQLQAVPEYNLLDCNEVIASPQSYSGRTIAVEAIFLYTQDTGSRIVQSLTDQTSAIELISNLPPTILKALDRHRVIAIGKFFNGTLNVENLEDLGG
jgi:hypothetical protein